MLRTQPESQTGDLRFVQAESPEQIETARALFREYGAALGFSLCFQDFDRELAELPGRYAPPSGRLLLCLVEDRAAGCAALRRSDPEACEMKRLYVRPEFRSRRLGEKLARLVIDEARRGGYRRMRLDTLPSMERAIALYRKLGFKTIEPYRDNPVAGALFLELALDG